MTKFNTLEAAKSAVAEGFATLPAEPALSRIVRLACVSGYRLEKIIHPRTASWLRCCASTPLRSQKVEQFVVGQNDGAGRAGVRDALRAEMRRLEAQPVGVARAAVRRGLGTEAFTRFKNGESARDGEEWAVAILDAARAHELGFGARPRVVRLSSDSVSTHPRFKNFDTQDWQRVQWILDEGSWEKQPENRRHFKMTVGGRPWEVVVKKTRSGEALYLLTILKKSSQRQHPRRSA